MTEDTGQAAAPSEHAAEPGRSQVIWLGAALLTVALVCGALGYIWTRKAPFPKFPIPCLGLLDGRCWDEQSGAFLYVDRPDDPIALKVTYGQNIYGPNGVGESIWIGANVPAGQTLHWMLQLYGVTRLGPQTFGPSVGGKRRRILLSDGVTLKIFHASTPNSGNTIQVLQGAITGPVRGFSTIKYETAVPVGFDSGGIDTAEGDATGAVIAQNSSYVLGNLPFIFAAGPTSVPGAKATAPDLSFAGFLVPGTWYWARTAFVDESYPMPVPTQLSWADPPPSTSGVPDWKSDRYVKGRFELTDLHDQNHRQEHEFWAGVALGVGGGALIGSIQTVALIPIRRRRKLKQSGRSRGRRLWHGRDALRRRLRRR